MKDFSVGGIFRKAAIATFIGVNLPSLVSSAMLWNNGLVNAGGIESMTRNNGYLGTAGAVTAGSLFMPAMEWMETLAEDKPMYQDGDLPKTPNDVLIGAFVKASRATLGDAGGAAAIFTGMMVDAIVSVPGSVIGSIAGIATYETVGPRVPRTSQP